METKFIKVERNVRSRIDARRRVDWWLFAEFRGADEYRFAVETKPGAQQPPAVRQAI